MKLIDTIKDNKRYYQDFIARFIKESNGIKGNSLSLTEIMILLFDINTKFRLDIVSLRGIKKHIIIKKLWIICLNV